MKRIGKIFGLTPYIITVLFLGISNFLIYTVIYIEQSRPELSVSFLDVGQADATLIETKNGNRVLIDVGGGRETAEKIANLLPFYDQRVDVVIITHPHADHMDGFVPLLDFVDVGLVLDSGSGHTTAVVEGYRRAIEDNSIKKIYARRGMTIRMNDEVALFVLFPNINSYELDPDNASIWTKLSYGETSFLFTGDSFSTIENYIVEIDGERLASDVFQAGHHGSKTSNSRALLRAVMPDFVVVSAGENNSFGHPHQESMDIFSYVGAEVLKTYTEGDIVFISDGTEIQRKK